MSIHSSVILMAGFCKVSFTIWLYAWFTYTCLAVMTAIQLFFFLQWIYAKSATSMLNASTTLAFAWKGFMEMALYAEVRIK